MIGEKRGHSAVSNAKAGEEPEEVEVKTVEVESILDEGAVVPDPLGSEPLEPEPLEIEPLEVEESADTTVGAPTVLESEGGDLPISSTTALVRYDSLEAYLSEIRNLPTLSRDEEHRLAVRYHETKDPQAAYKLVLANLRLVVSIAREYQRNFKNILDLIQEGNIGLLEAVQQFDPFRGIRFPSYAVYWIRAYMLRYLINNLRLVKIGTTQAQRKLFFNLQKEKERLEAEGFTPEAKLLAERLDVKESEVIEMQQRLSLPDLSVDAPMKAGDGEEGGDLHQILPSHDASAEDLVISGDFSHAVREAVESFKANLDEKERAIVDGRLFTEDPVTLQEIADKFQLSRERIRQIESRLKEKLKRYLQNRLDLNQQGEISIDEEGGIFLFLLVLFAMLGAIYAGLQYTPLADHAQWGRYLNFFERGKPKVEISNPPPGVGSSAGVFQVVVKDDGAGLDEVIIRAEQGADSKEVLRRRYDQPVRTDTIPVRIHAKELKLSEGHFALEVVAFDRSFFSNGETVAVEFPIDFRKPQIQVISVQHNAVIGGSELVFYRLKDDDLAWSGVEVGKARFKGFPAHFIDRDFTAVPDLYFALFAVPLSFNEESDEVVVSAVDTVGNGSRANFYYRAQRVRAPLRIKEIEKTISEENLRYLINDYQKQEGAEKGSRLTTMLDRFTVMNSTVRRASEIQIRNVLKNSAEQVAFQVPFYRPNAVARSDFGEIRRYQFEEQEVGESVEGGVDFGMASGSEVLAAEAGTVRFAGSQGVYGNTVVLDHGGGLATLYGHLHAIEVKEGERVTREQRIGVVGSTGMCADERLRVEFRLHGEPVRPIEWWDKYWVRDHISNKIDEVKRTLGIALPEENDESQKEGSSSREQRGRK